MKIPQLAGKNSEPLIRHNRLKEKTAPFSDKIDLIKSLILNSVNEEVIKKVYLFGSYAYGEPSEDSDIDLCVVIGNKYKRADIYLDIATKLYENKIIPCDLMVYNEKYFVGAESGRGIENTIMNRGTLLYGQ
ncbi:MAG: nucleotidyltransferase domain-containing protein [Treponema sp.]|jgi:predicted nucleotidyltransferase|nr:nucleotidyltransferase domain-containing protein [Treponema sp.]